MPFQPYLKESYVICCSLSSHENHVIRAAAVEALANLYIAIKRCYVDESASMYSSVLNQLLIVSLKNKMYASL